MDSLSQLTAGFLRCVVSTWKQLLADSFLAHWDSVLCVEEAGAIVRPCVCVCVVVVVCIHAVAFVQGKLDSSQLVCRDRVGQGSFLIPSRPQSRAQVCVWGMGVDRRVTKHRKPDSSKPVIFQVRKQNPEKIRLQWGLPMLRRGRDGIRAQVSNSHFRGRAAEHGPQAQGQLEGGRGSRKQGSGQGTSVAVSWKVRR